MALHSCGDSIGANIDALGQEALIPADTDKVFGAIAHGPQQLVVTHGIEDAQRWGFIRFDIEALGGELAHRRGRGRLGANDRFFEVNELPGQVRMEPGHSGGADDHVHS